jgi:trimeric autotransporter adhesin
MNKNVIKSLQGTLALAVFSLVSVWSAAQCTVEISPNTNPLYVDCGESVDLSALGLSTTPALMTNFDGNAIGAGWSTSATLLYNNPCSPSLDGTPAAWFGDVPLPRRLTTNGFDLSCGGQVCFDLDFSNDEGGVNCEDPDETDEGVFFRYSVNGGLTWVDLFYFEPTSNVSGPYYSWANYCFVLPPGASTANTMFQWDQPNATDTDFDHWGIDNVSIIPSNCNYYYDWNNVPGSNNAAAQTVYPAGDTTFIVTYTDGTNACYDTIDVIVNQLQVNATASLTQINCPDCVDLEAEVLGGFGALSDDFDPGIDPAVWGDIQGAVAGGGCGGVNGNALYFDNASASRHATTIPISAANCSSVDFCLFVGNNSSGAACAAAEANEDIIFEYSINGGGSWLNIATYDESLWDANNAWQCFSPTLPMLAQSSPSVIFRWRQINFESDDNWSLDNVSFNCIPSTVTYAWTGEGLSNPAIQTPQGCPLIPTEYVVTVTETISGCSATDTVAVNVICGCQFYNFQGTTSNCENGNTFTLSGDFSYYTNPGTGTIEIEATNSSGTYTQTINGPFTDAVTFPYSISGIPSDGSPLSVNIYFSDDLTCSAAFNTVSPSLPEVTAISGGAFYCPTDPMDAILVTVTGNSPYTIDYTVNGVPQTATSNTTTVDLGNNVGVYVLTTVSDAGCTNTALGSDSIVLSPVPNVVSISGGDTYCTGDPVNPIEVLMDGTGPFVLTYTLNNVPNTANSATTTINLGSTTGTYVLTGISDAYCSNTASQTDEIILLPLPNVNAGADVIVCDGNSTVLTGSGALSYEWNNGISNAVPFYPNATQVYTVTGTDANGCINTDEVTVTLEALPVVSFTADITAGCSPLEVQFTNTTPGNLVLCEWQFQSAGSQSDCGTVSATFENPGLFDASLTVTSINGCVNDITYDNYIYVEADPLASFSASETVLTNLETEVFFQNSSTGSVTYQWDFGDGSPNESGLNALHEFPLNSTSNYGVYLVAYSELGCTDTAKIVIQVTEELIFYVPNSFTPDGDEYNNVFQPVFTSGFDPYDFSVLIFNRWGEVMWESFDPNAGWDGTYHNELVPQGAYTWQIEFKTADTDERKRYSGHVTILK